MYTFGDIGYEHTVIYRLIIMYIPWHLGYEHDRVRYWDFIHTYYRCID
jgi:hypothetical protein